MSQSEGGGDRRIAITLERPVTCGHCRTETPTGSRVYIHCPHCFWFTCPVCGALNGRGTHTHKDHPKKCPSRGFK